LIEGNINFVYRENWCFCGGFVAGIVDERLSFNRKDYERFETAIGCELDLVLEDFLLPDETVRYESPSKVRYLGDKFYFYITNQRILAYRSKGKVFKKDKIIAERLEGIQSLNYYERGFVRKKGCLSVQTESKRMYLEGKIPDVKGIWQELQKYIKKET